MIYKRPLLFEGITTGGNLTKETGYIHRGMYRDQIYVGLNDIVHGER